MIASKAEDAPGVFPPNWQLWGGKWWLSHDPDWEYEGEAWRLVSGFKLTFSVQVL